MLYVKHLLREYNMLTDEEVFNFLGEDYPYVIDYFQARFFFLSNFYPSPIQVGNTVYPTLEHAYQAAKATNKEDRLKIFNAKHPAEAKKIGKNITVRKDWNELKLPLMEELLRIKFSDPELKKQLLNTRNLELIEGNWHGDTFWGKCNKVGENNLGKLLMKIREEFKLNMHNH